ncbi:uncharacterized protein LOC108028648 [Drosophila biarmipes]|uniref:uncharacterized protein LOC108028648 n=1 Tax=Drosophila biarmipes TaxID=125945 RepID=UPI0007E6B3D3|nr:uncharacterized protein LOC108028648 [Drosophila biarmipes]
MGWILVLLLFGFAGVLANKKEPENSNRKVIKGRTISVNTSTSGLHDAVGGTLVPGSGFLQQIEIGNLPHIKGRPLPDLGNDVVITSESTHSKNGQENSVMSKVQSLTKKPSKRSTPHKLIAAKAPPKSSAVE